MPESNLRKGEKKHKSMRGNTALVVSTVIDMGPNPSAICEPSIEHELQVVPTAAQPFRSLAGKRFRPERNYDEELIIDKHIVDLFRGLPPNLAKRSKIDEAAIRMHSSVRQIFPEHTVDDVARLIEKVIYEQ